MTSKVLVLICGVFACSTAVIMIKLGRMDAILLSSLRQLVAVLVLLPFFLRDLRKVKTSASTLTRASILPGILLGLHFISWIIGARLTPAANSSLIVNMVPVVMPFMLLAVVRERLNRGEILGTVLALAGTMLLGHSDFRISRDSFVGDLLCILSMLLFAGYLVLARRSSRDTPLWLYVTPLYTCGGLFCLLAACFLSDFSGLASPREWLLVLGLALIPTVVGHSILNHAMRTMRGQSVAIINLGQFIFAGILAFFMLGEVPSATFYPASLLVVVGAVMAIRTTPSTAS